MRVLVYTRSWLHRIPFPRVLAVFRARMFGGGELGLRWSGSGIPSGIIFAQQDICDRDSIAYPRRPVHTARFTFMQKILRHACLY
jgi:hypothetical protein